MTACAGPAVLVITSRFDPHADRVIPLLGRRGVPVFRLNTDDFHADTRVAAGEDGVLRLRSRWGRTHDFPRETRSVWFRKPSDPVAPAGLDDPQAQDLVRRETLEFLDYLGAEEGVPWVSNPRAIAWAGRKLPQLALARRLGLRVPRTLVTNDPAEAAAFHAAVGGRLLCKAMKAVGFGDGDDHRSLFARAVPESEFAAHLADIAHCPTLFQEYVEKDHELRITFLGERVFCCRIDSQGIAGARTDWRRVDPFSVPHRMVDLAPAVEAALRRMLAAYGLPFGAFDMIVTPEGEPVFLELNPNGQWLWMELITGAPMAEAMADLLAG